MALLLLLTTCITLCYSMQNEREHLYLQLDRIDNEMRRLCDIQNELAYNKTKILRQLRELDNLQAIAQPTKQPTESPTLNPTNYPSQSPTTRPTFNPTVSPTSKPSNTPSKAPTMQPTTMQPTRSPTKSPTRSPTIDLSPMKQNIQKSKFHKSARRRREKESANKLDDDLLEAAIHSQKKKVAIVKLFTYGELGVDEETKLIDLFEKELMMNFNNAHDLIIINSFLGADIDEYVNNTKTIGHPSDIFLMEFIERLIGRIYTRTLSAQRLADYVYNSLQRLAAAELTGILHLVVDRLNLMPQTTQSKQFIDYINDSGYGLNYTTMPLPDFDVVPVYDIMLHFLQFVFEEVISYKVRDAAYDLDNSQYGKSGKVPSKYRACLAVIQEQQYVQSNVAEFFAVAVSENSSEVYAASKGLKDSLQILHLMTSNFQIGKTIYDWQQNQDGKDGVIAISATVNTETKQINDFLMHLGYNESQIERYRVVQDPKTKKINLIASVIQQIGDDAVKVTKFAKDDVYLYEKQLFEANDEKNDLVFVMDLNILDESRIKKGRYCLVSEFDLRSRSIIVGFENFLSRILWPFQNTQKRVLNVLISCVIFPLTVLHECLFDSIMAEFDELSAKKNLTEWKQMSKITQIGYEIMRKSGKYEELKMIQLNGKNNDGILEAVFGFVEIVIKQIYLIYIESNEFDDTIKNMSFVQIEGGGIKELFASIDNLRRDAENEILKFSKFMKRFTKRCLEGGVGGGFRRGQNNLPDIFKKINEFRVNKGMLRMGNILYEWRQKHEKSVIFIGFDHLCFPHFDNEQKITLFLNAIGYKNIAINDESKVFEQNPRRRGETNVVASV